MKTIKQDKKLKVKNILVSQPTPATIEKSPFYDITEKHKSLVDYRPFIKVVGVTFKEFRAQRVEILDHTAVIFTNRTTIDSFFRLCEESRITVPETMKYFCNTEAVALYLQKYIIYRKRKIFFANGSFQTLMELILKHKEEKFLLTLSEPHKPEMPQTMEKLKLKHSKAILAKTIGADLEGVDLKKYDLLVFYSPSEINTLINTFGRDNLPFIATFGDGTTKCAIESGLTVNVMAPTPEAPSMAKAVDIFITKMERGEKVEPVQIETSRSKAEEFIKAQESKPSRRAKKKPAVAAKTTTKKETVTSPVGAKTPARAAAKAPSKSAVATKKPLSAATSKPKSTSAGASAKRSSAAKA